MAKNVKPKVRSCRVCGCTDNDCSGCIKKQGYACYWVEADLCSACVDTIEPKFKKVKIKEAPHYGVTTDYM